MRLRRADCSRAGITRVRRGRGFSYLDADGDPVDDATLERIRELAIPPAWQDVWICPDERGHLQATGIDAAGRKQYLYHPVWREQRDRQKFRDMEEFARVLPRLRRHVSTDLEETDELTRRRVAAFATRLLDIGLFRLGGEEYAEQGGGHGLATLLREHVRFEDGVAVFDYPAKSGVRRLHSVADPDSLQILQQLHRRRSGPDELLAYREGRRWHPLGSAAITDYIKSAAGPDFSAKDFRTWNGTVLAAARLAAAGDPPRGRTGRERVIRRVVKDVAEALGNTPAVARRSYIDPRVLDRYLSGWTIDVSVGGADGLDDFGERRRRRVELAVLELLADA